MTTLLGVIGSPRRNGNTDILVSRILEGAKDNGAAVETVFLNDLTIRECTGCHTCWSGKPCPLNDDMLDLYPKIVASDAIVFGTPVYWYGPTALMKAFIDRFVYFNCPENRKKIAGKAAAIAVPYEDEDAETVAPLVTFFEKSFQYLQMDFVARVIVPGVGAKGDILKKPDRLEEARALGADLAE